MTFCRKMSWKEHKKQPSIFCQWNYGILIGCVNNNQKPRFNFYKFLRWIVDSCRFSLSIVKPSYATVSFCNLWGFTHQRFSDIFRGYRKRPVTLYGLKCLFKCSHMQPPEVFCKKAVLKYFAKFAEKHLCQSLIFNKVAGLRPATSIKRGLWHRCFLWILRNF